MTKRVAVVGAGMGGLTAALRLRQAGHDVTVFEARSGSGGLASSFEIDGLRFDGGPYVLLDTPGLEWAFDELGVPLDARELVRIDAVYEVLFDDGRSVRFYHDLDRTVAEMDRDWPGSGKRYRELVAKLAIVYRDTRPLQFLPRPGLGTLTKVGAIRHLFFFLRGLEAVLRGSGLPREVRDAVMIWTHIAGQPTSRAPSPLALVPALIHGEGAYYPMKGMGSLAASLEAAARDRGVRFHFDTRVRSIEGGRERVAVEIDGDERDFDAVVSNAHGVGTYLSLVSDLAPRVASKLAKLPLQPPGFCDYLKVRGAPSPMYLRFRLSRADGCRVFVDPRCVGVEGNAAGWHPARLIAPRELVAPDDAWWRAPLDAHEVLARRTPSDWGREFHLYRDTMNPVMTARFMRQGRLRHKSPYVPGLYLAGSSTHPGQWVSFCAISGILAADRVHEDS